MQIIVPIIHFAFSSKLYGFRVLFNDYENIHSTLHRHIRKKETWSVPNAKNVIWALHYIDIFNQTGEKDLVTV